MRELSFMNTEFKQGKIGQINTTSNVVVLPLSDKYQFGITKHIGVSKPLDYIAKVDSPQPMKLVAEYEKASERVEANSMFEAMQHFSIGVIQLDQLWDLTFVSKGWLTFLGYSENQLVGREWVNIVHQQDRDIFLDQFYENVKKEKNSEQDIRVVKMDGSIKWFTVHYSINAIKHSQEKK